MLFRLMVVIGISILFFVALFVIVRLEKQAIDRQKQKWQLLIHDVAYASLACMTMMIIDHTHNSVAVGLFILAGLIVLQKMDANLSIKGWSQNRKRFLHAAALFTIGSVAAVFIQLVQISF